MHPLPWITRLTLVVSCLYGAAGLVPNQGGHQRTTVQSHSDAWCGSRRELCGAIVGSGVGAAATAIVVETVTPAGAVAAGEDGEGKRWISGKSDVPVPKGETKGTKKDIGFLRCLSNCVSDCQKIGASGVPKGRDDCLIECQNECCMTYEQCTCTLNPNLV